VLVFSAFASRPISLVASV